MNPYKCIKINENPTRFNKELFFKNEKSSLDKFELESIKVLVSFKVAKISQNPTVDLIVHYRNIYGGPENFIKRRVDYSRMKVFDNKYREEKERLKSFSKFPKELFHLVEPLARSGFYFIGNSEEPDKVKCIFCQGILHQWKKNDNPEKDHKKAFPTCPFLLNLNVSNVKMDQVTSKFPNEDPDLKKFDGEIYYNVIGKIDEINIFDINEFDIESREKTFSNRENLKNLSLDGVYVKKESDKEFLCCFKCNKSIEILKNVETLPREMFHYLNCDYFKSVENLSIIKEQVNHMKNKNQCRVEYLITDEEIEARIDSRIANRMENLNNCRSKIKFLIEKRVKQTGKDYDSTYEFFSDLKNYREIKQSIHEDNYQLEFLFPNNFCVVCLDKSATVVFLPCGHLKTCNDCSSLVSSCPVCRTVIERRVWGIIFVNINVISNEMEKK